MDVVTPPATDDTVDALLQHCGIGDIERDAAVELDGVAPGCRFAVAEAAATVLAACGAAAAEIWRQRGGARQSVRVSSFHAGASLRSYALQTVGGQSAGASPSDDNPLSAFYPTRDGRYFFVHGVLPHLARGTLEVLGLREASWPGVAAAVAKFDGLALEEAMAAAGQCGAMARNAAEWDAHPQGQACRRAGAVAIDKLGDSPPEPFAAGADRPLSDIRVLDLTRILAGPTGARTLAAHGAQVLHITSPRLDSVRPFIIDTGPGKRAASLDLDHAADAATLRRLVAGADVFSQGYRSGGLARRGLGPEQLAALRPGIVCVSINCYGHDGPWVGRPGWDQLAGAVSGMSVTQGEPGPPQQNPAAACDYVTGYLAALGAMAALLRRARTGGSYHVKVSLSQTAIWLRDFAPPYPRETAPDFSVPAALFQETKTPFGLLRHLRPPTRMSATPAGWSLPPVPLGTHSPAWVG